MKKAIEYLLFKSDVSNYKISKATGIRENVLSNYATGKSNIGGMTLDNAEKLYKYFKEMLIKMENQFGSVTFEGKEYILTDQAVITGRQLNNGQDFSDKSDGETYEFEMSAPAVDADGDTFTVYWIFEDIKGEGGQEDMSNFDYDNVDRIKARD